MGADTAGRTDAFTRGTRMGHPSTSGGDRAQERVPLTLAAEGSVERLKDQPGFKDYPEGFQDYSRTFGRRWLFARGDGFSHSSLRR
jgi:hypothetical protein